MKKIFYKVQLFFAKIFWQGNKISRAIQWEISEDEFELFAKFVEADFVNTCKEFKAKGGEISDLMDFFDMGYIAHLCDLWADFFRPYFRNKKNPLIFDQIEDKGASGVLQNFGVHNYETFAEYTKRQREMNFYWQKYCQLKQDPNV